MRCENTVNLVLSIASSDTERKIKFVGNGAGKGEE